MALVQQPATLPPGAKSIVARVTGAATLYTAVAGRRLHIVSLWISTQGSTTNGNVAIAVTPENGSAQTALDLQVAGTAAIVASNISITVNDLPTVSNVSTASNTVTGTSSFGLCGWEEALPGDA